jgi:hypothetical protein
MVARVPSRSYFEVAGFLAEIEPDYAKYLDPIERKQRLAAKGMQFPRRWECGTRFTNLDVIWGMKNGRIGLL